MWQLLHRAMVWEEVAFEIGTMLGGVVGRAYWLADVLLEVVVRNHGKAASSANAASLGQHEPLNFRLMRLFAPYSHT